MKTKQTLFLITILTLCISCNINPIDGGSKTQHETHAIVPLQLEQTEKELLTPTNDFTLQTFKYIAENSTNTFVSPLSAAFVLSMLTNGADGNTLAELQTSLGYDNISLDDQNAYFHKLLTALPYQDSTTLVELANALFIDNNFPIYEDFKTVNEANYLAQIENLPMRSNSTAAANTINQWAAQKTHNCIQEIVTPEQLQAAIMAVCNAIYFKGYWKEQFSKNNTYNETFYTTNGEQTTAFMHQTANYAYSKNETCQYLSIPYEGNSYCMNIILPNNDTNIQDFIQNFTLQQLNTLQSEASSRYDVNLSLPKFKAEFNTDLIPAMNALGIKEAFTTKANFNKISQYDTFIQAFYQKAYVAVDEEGTEAAAVTIGIIAPTCVGPGEEITFKANRPFLYLIREQKTGLILFIGKMDTPQ